MKRADSLLVYYLKMTSITIHRSLSRSHVGFLLIQVDSQSVLPDERDTGQNEAFLPLLLLDEELRVELNPLGVTHLASTCPTGA